jgi:hypothetical protein
MTLLTLLQSVGAPIAKVAGSTRLKKYIIDYTLQRKVNMHILTLSI